MTDPFGPIRFQGDGKQQEYSDAAAITFDPANDRTRQEFKDETDINIILRKMGVPLHPLPLVFGEMDYSLDLQDALTAVNDAQRVFNKLPEQLQAKYADWRNMLAAIANNTFPEDWQAATIKVEAPPANPPVKVDAQA